MSDYIFEDAESRREIERLRAIEAIFDPRTQSHLEATGDWAGRLCLEVGAGAGSIAAWMASRAGPTGRVTAVDVRTRFLAPLGSSVDVVEGDIRKLDLASPGFDVSHARYVVIHNTGAPEVLDAIVGLTKPGGWILIEEPDFSVARPLAGPAALVRAFEQVCLAIDRTFAAHGLDHAFGRRLPALLDERGVEIVAVDHEAPAVPGGTPIANMMSLSGAQLRQKYVATGVVTDEGVGLYREFAATPSCWAVYYSTVRVLARRPPEAMRGTGPTR